MTKPAEVSTDRAGIDILDAPGRRNLRRKTIKMMWVVVVVALCAAAVHFSPLKLYLTDLQMLKAALRDTGVWAPVVFLGVAAISMFVGAPRLPFCVLAGVLFGFIQGLSLSLAATVVGAYGPFLFARYSSRDWVEAKLQRFDRLRQFLRNPSVLDIFLIRQISIWGVVINVLLGSTRVSHRTFIIGSFLGFLPQALIFTLIGSGAGKESVLHGMSQILAAAALLIVVTYFSWRLVRRPPEKAELRRSEA